MAVFGLIDFIWFLGMTAEFLGIFALFWTFSIDIFWASYMAQSVVDEEGPG